MVKKHKKSKKHSKHHIAKGKGSNVNHNHITVKVGTGGGGAPAAYSNSTSIPDYSGHFESLKHAIVSLHNKPLPPPPPHGVPQTIKTPASTQTVKEVIQRPTMVHTSTQHKPSMRDISMEAKARVKDQETQIHQAESSKQREFIPLPDRPKLKPHTNVSQTTQTEKLPSFPSHTSPEILFNTPPQQIRDIVPHHTPPTHAPPEIVMRPVEPTPHPIGYHPTRELELFRNAAQDLGFTAANSSIGRDRGQVRYINLEELRGKAQKRQHNDTAPTAIPTQVGQARVEPKRTLLKRPQGNRHL